MLSLSDDERNAILGRLPLRNRSAPGPGRKPHIKNYDTATRVMFGVGAAVEGVTKTAKRGGEVETLDGDMVPVEPSLPTVANARDGKIGNRFDDKLNEQVEQGLKAAEEIGVDRLNKCLELVSEEEIEDLSVRDRVGMGVHLSQIINNISKRTDSGKTGQGISLNFYAPEKQRELKDMGPAVVVEREKDE